MLPEDGDQPDVIFVTVQSLNSVVAERLLKLTDDSIWIGTLCKQLPYYWPSTKFTGKEPDGAAQGRHASMVQLIDLVSGFQQHSDGFACGLLPGLPMYHPFLEWRSSGHHVERPVAWKGVIVGTSEEKRSDLRQPETGSKVEWCEMVMW